MHENNNFRTTYRRRFRNKKQISYINVPAGVIRTYRAYQLSDNQNMKHGKYDYKISLCQFSWR